MKIDTDDFALFGLPRRFALDSADLDGRRRSLQAEVHPDRFAAAGAAAQRLSMQWAVRVNEAYHRLRDPLRRAGYLCELAGVPVSAEENTAMPAAFLEQQMSWREALDEASTPEAIEAVAGTLVAERDRAFAGLEQSLDVDEDPAAAARQVRALMFVERFAADVDQRLAGEP